MPCLLEERQCPFAYTAQFGEHRFFGGKLRRWRHDRRHLALNHARFDQSQRKVQPFAERYGQRRFSDDPVGVAADAALDVRKVGYEFACPPASRLRLLVPHLDCDRLGSPQELGLSTSQLAKNRLQVSHASCREFIRSGP